MIGDEALTQRYARYKALIGDEPMPAALVDLDAIDENMKRLSAKLGTSRATIRVASKSVRCADLLRYLMTRGGAQFKGLLCFSAREAAWLAGNGFTDLIVAYPTVQKADLEAVCLQAQQVSVSVDCAEQVTRIADAAAQAGVVVQVIIDVDSSLRFGPVHLGVRRSPIHSADQMLAVLNAIEGRKSLRFRGLMVYEAHVAGLVDNSPFAPVLNLPHRAFKKVARVALASLRETLAKALINRGYKDFLFNGAGTGSADVAKTEHWLTEVTIGSGYLASHLFDYYQGLSLIPAATYAAQVTRHPAPGFVTVHGGGFTASGGIGPDRLPLPYLPEGLSVIKDEGIGEVQSGLGVPEGVTLGLGDPVFFRHAKAGELAEHFNDYLLIRGDKVVSRAKTYRGDGQCF